MNHTVYMVTVEFNTAPPFYTVKRFLLASKEEAEKLKEMVLRAKGKIVFMEPHELITADEAAKKITNEAKEWLRAMGEM